MSDQRFYGFRNLDSPSCTRLLPRPASMVTPSTSQLQPATFQHSISFPTRLHPSSPGPEDNEDMTLLYLPPSCGDLTAFASEWTNSLASSTPNINKRNTLPLVYDIDTPLKNHPSQPIATIHSLSATTTTWLSPQNEQNVISIPCISTYTDLTSFSHAPLINPAIRSITTPVPTERNVEINLLPHTHVSQIYNLTSNLSSLEGHHVSSYNIIGTLGRGTYGKVVLAYLKGHSNNDLCAVKVIRKTCHYSIGSELNILKSISESLTSSTLGHLDGEVAGLRFLQRLLSSFEDETSIYIILEYHPTTLSDPETADRFRLRKSEHPGLSASVSLPLTLTGRLPTSNSCEESIVFLRLLAAEICLGLLFIHREGVVHQDIKTANIMISFAGHAVIGDFGAASNLPVLPATTDTNTARSCSPKYGRIMLQPDEFITFTPLYAAPELRERGLNGVVVYDERSDWWSLGVLLHELATGTVPFNTSGGTDTLRRGRRSDGDHSLTFGALEKLSVAFEKTSRDWFPNLTNFLKALLVHDPDDRLSGEEVRNHPFFDPVRESWADIAALKYPPCCNPPTSHVDEDASFAFEDSAPAEAVTQDTCSAHGSHFSNERIKEPDIESDVFLDNFYPSLHSTIRIGGALEPWRPRGRFLDDEEDDWDIRSAVQPMPSSASIWDRLSEEVQDSGLCIPSGTMKLISSHSRHDHDLVAPSHQLEPLLTLLLPNDTPGCVSQSIVHPLQDYPKEHQPIFEYALPLSESILQEKITLSLLEAMDIRDRHGTLYLYN